MFKTPPPGTPTKKLFSNPFSKSVTPSPIKFNPRPYSNQPYNPTLGEIAARPNDPVQALAAHLELTGVDPNVITLDATLPLNKRTQKYSTALHCAILARNYRCVELLLQSGAKLDTRDHCGRTPLLAAVDGIRCAEDPIQIPKNTIFSPEIVDLLLKNRALPTLDIPMAHQKATHITTPLKLILSCWWEDRSDKDKKNHLATAYVLASYGASYKPQYEFDNQNNPIPHQIYFHFNCDPTTTQQPDSGPPMATNCPEFQKIYNFARESHSIRYRTSHVNSENVTFPRPWPRDVSRHIRSQNPNAKHCVIL